MQEYLIGVYQEVGKKANIIKIKNDKSYIEKLICGEFESINYDDYIILYKKDSEHLLPNVYIPRFSKIGLSIKGNVFIVSKDEDNNFISLNKIQLKKCLEFLLKESFSYKKLNEKNQDINKLPQEEKRTYSKDELLTIESIRKLKNPFKMITVKDVMKDLNICETVAYRMFKRDDFPSINIGKTNQVMLLSYLLWKMEKRN